MQKVTTYRKSDADYYDWLVEKVYWNSSDRQVSRAKAISFFVKEGLYPFINSYGYSWGCTLRDLENKVATGLYNNIGRHYLESKWDFESYNTAFTDEDVWHYDSVISTDAWREFWSQWALWCDVDPTTERGVDRQNDIERFCWTQLNLDKSPQTNILMEYIRNGEYEDMMGGGGGDTYFGRAAVKKEDTYLKEAAESNQWYGWRR
jgi:hypothetical protein